jgi:flavin reductase (DIM6/NTAB) family NADH-FMN oxidoreductase RutF
MAPSPAALQAVAPEDHAPSALYRLMIGMITPRPIAWVGTRGADGVDNLAPFSFFMGVGSAPPMVALSVARGPGGALKDTARNLLERRDCTITLPQAGDLAWVAASGAAAPPALSEFALLGLEKAPAARVAACWPAGARLVMEGRLHSHLDLGSTHLFVVEIVLFHVDPALLRVGDTPLISSAANQPLSRLGGADYGLLGDVLSEPIPSLDALLRRARPESP